MAAQPTAAGWILRMGSTAGIVGALLGLVGNLLHPATPTGDPAGGPRHRRQPTLGPRSPRHGPRPDPRARRPGCHRPVHPRRPPRGPGQAGLGRRRRRRHRGPQPGHLDGLAAKQLAEAWATAPPQEQAAALRLVLAEETINVALAPCSTSVRRRDLHPLRPSRGLEPALPTLAGTG
jgi:hypothetical protein